MTARVFVLPLVFYMLWVVGVVLAGRAAGIWELSLLKDTAAWFVVAGVVLFFSFVKAGSEAGFFRRTLGRTVRLAAFLEFYLNLAVFDLWIELLLQPLLLFASLVSLIGSRDPKAQPARRFADGLLALLGIGLLLGTAFELSQIWGTLDARETLLSFALPIWLTLSGLPVIWLLSAYANYQSAFLRVKWMSPDKRLSWRSRLAMWRTFHVRHRQMHGFGGLWAKQLAEAPNWSTACGAVEDFLADRRGQEEQERRRHEALVRNAGVEGTDAEGRQRDRREFAETIDALEWLHTCQMGWYRNRTKGRYPADLLKIFQPGFTRGLPDDHGIEMRVRRDGKAWYAWRQTVTGWVFAIGAAGPPPNQWFWDGPKPPPGFPGRSWMSRPFERGPNWED
ncbi:MAG: hypothetical protein H0U86_12580 [Chloroflexi bacterium]|nr:hypothetical protein [Chloroflexota bacterium]